MKKYDSAISDTCPLFLIHVNRGRSWMKLERAIALPYLP